MKKGDVTCCKCGAGFRRIEVSSLPGAEGEYRCVACGHLLEKLLGDRLVEYRLTVQPSIKALSE